MRAARSLVLIVALTCASGALAADDCALERAQSMLATHLKDWFIVNNSAWLRDPDRYAARALDPLDVSDADLRHGLVIEVTAPSHGSCVRWLVETDSDGEPKFTVLDERSCSRLARKEHVVHVVLEEVDMRPNDVPMGGPFD